MKFLPSFASLDRWMAKVKFGEPGIQKESIEKVSMLLTKLKHLVFGITFDEIHIKKQDKKNWDFKAKKF